MFGTAPSERTLKNEQCKNDQQRDEK